MTESKSLILNYSGKTLEAGVDEAGRGCLAGPVVAAALILPPDFTHVSIRDSKALTAEQRFAAREIILEKCVSWAVGVVSAERIDAVNILNAALEAMREAIALLPVCPEAIIVDGKRVPLYREDAPAPFYSFIKGDRDYLSIAGASILAKTFRDEIMVGLDADFPVYNWKQNKGYPTREHRRAILQYGDTSFHRKTFRVLPPD